MRGQLLIISHIIRIVQIMSKAWNFLPVLVHAVSFIFMSGGKADLTSEDSERSMISKYQNIDVWRHWLMVNMFMM